jgi:hypothetical protein
MRPMFRARFLSPSYKPHRLVRGAVDILVSKIMAQDLPFAISLQSTETGYGETQLSSGVLLANSSLTNFL